MEHGHVVTTKSDTAKTHKMAEKRNERHPCGFLGTSLRQFITHRTLSFLQDNTKMYPLKSDTAPTI